MASDIDDMFKGMADAPPPGSGTYINGDGDFLVEVVKAFGKEGFKGKSYIVEFKILESSNPDAAPVGATRSWTLKWDKKQNHADLKAFALAVTDLESAAETKREAEITATYMVFASAGQLVAGDASLKAKQLLEAAGGFEGFEGLKVRLNTEKRPTQAGGEFTRHRWTPAS